MTSCSALNCPNESEISVKKGEGPPPGFHRFPENASLRTKWLIAMKRPHLNLKTDSVLCAGHFNPEDYTESDGSRKLKETAVPSIFSSSARSRFIQYLTQIGRTKRRPCPKSFNYPGETKKAKANEVTPATSNRKQKSAGSEDERSKAEVELDLMKHQLSEDSCSEEDAVVVSKSELQEHAESPIASTSKKNREISKKQLQAGDEQGVKFSPNRSAMSKKDLKPVNVTTIKDRNLLFNTTVLSSDELKSMKKDKLPPSTIYRLIVPVPSKGELNTEKIVKQVIAGLPQLEALASDPNQPPPLISMSNAADSSKQSPKSRSVKMQSLGSLVEGKTVKNLTSEGTSSSDDSQVEDQLKITSSHSLSPLSSKEELVSMNYQKKIKILKQRLRRMSAKIANMTEQLKNAQAEESMKREPMDNIIIIETNPATKRDSCRGKTTLSPANENVNSILMGAVNQQVPPPVESKYAVADFEKLVSRVSSIKQGLKNKEIVKCIVLQTADLEVM